MKISYRWFGLASVFAIMVVLTGVHDLGAFQSVVLYEDSFNSDRSGWKENAIWTYTGGQYRVFLRNPGSISGSELPDVSVFGRSTYCAEVDIKLLTGSGLAEDGFVGFYIGGTDIPRFSSVPDRAVLFGLDSFERLLILRVTRESSGLIELGVISSINDAFEDPNVFHTLQLDADGSRIRVSMDGEFVTTVSAAASGNMGFMAFTFDDPNLNARFDNMVIRNVCEE